MAVLVKTRLKAHACMVLSYGGGGGAAKGGGGAGSAFGGGGGDANPGGGSGGGGCKSSYIMAPKARESLGFYPKSYSGFGSSQSCAPPLVDDSVLSLEELGSTPARIGHFLGVTEGKLTLG